MFLIMQDQCEFRQLVAQHKFFSLGEVVGAMKKRGGEGTSVSYN